MAQNLKVGITGLSTNVNHQTLEAGAIVNASNMNVDRKLAESRRGFTKHSALANIESLTEYQDKLIARTTADALKYYSGGSWNTYSGTFARPETNVRTRFIQANQNLYFNTSTGVKVLDAYNGTVYGTGMPKGLDGSGSTTGASGFMATNTQVAYRVVWGARDANSNLYLGAPSQRIIVSNISGGNRDISLTFTVPSGITTSDFFQVYRSRQSASSSTEPDDELSLVYETNPTAGEVSALSVTFTDSCDDSLVGAYLYTNANQEGITESNDIPPYAKDLCTFKGFTFFANIKTKYRIDVDLLSVGGSSGLVANDTITVYGMQFTAKAATTVASREFKVFTSGTAAQNVEDTAKELVKVINQYSSNTTVYAYYESGFDDLPGQISIEERTLSSSAFTVSVSRATAWSLENSGTSLNSEYKHGLMWSKVQQPEHVPAAHLEFVGGKTYSIKRVLALKDSLFILKEDGVYRLTGTNGNWSIEGFDTSTSIIAPESAVVVNNQIICLSNQGVVTISDVGVSIISIDIKDSIQSLIGIDYAALKNYTFGVGYDTEGRYILSTFTSLGDTSATQQWVYNVFTSKWSRWDKDANCGFVAPSVDKLYFADASNLLEERKSFTYRDFVDEEFGSYSVVSNSGTSVVLNSVLGLTVGDLLYESTSVYSPILTIDPATNTVTVADSYTWAVAAVTVYFGIDMQLEWAPTYCDNSGIEKAFQELQVMFKRNQFREGTVDFYTDLNGGFESVAVDGQYGGGLWGLFGWGQVPWGGESRAIPVRVSVPRSKSRGQLLAIRFSCRMAYSQIIIEGYSLDFEFVSERQGTRLG